MAHETIHPSITEAKIIRAVKSSMFGTKNPGFCTKCGKKHDGCEPDMRGGKCTAKKCGALAVEGAEWIMIGHF